MSGLTEDDFVHNWEILRKGSYVDVYIKRPSGEYDMVAEHQMVKFGGDAHAELVNEFGSPENVFRNARELRRSRRGNG